jgi:hypothetical protein
MTLSKKNTGLLIIVTLILVIALFAMMATVTTFAGDFSWSSAPHLVAHCAGSTCGIA